MPQITALTSQKSKKRVNIYVDGKFSFGVDLDNLLRFGLKEGKELTQEQLEEIIKKAEFQKVFDKIVAYGSLRPRSEKEYKDWLRKYKVHESMQEELFDKLRRLELLDDEKFATWWVGQRNEFKPRSKSALTFELLKKGIARDVIKKALSEVEVDEGALARDLVLRKKRVWEKLDGQEQKKKIQMLLASKGFGWDVVKKVIYEVLNVDN
jgi:regulatory protein